MATFVKLEYVYETDSDGIEITGYNVTTEINKVDNFKSFKQHKKAMDYIHSINPDLIIWPNGNITIKPNVFSL